MANVIANLREADRRELSATCEFPPNVASWARRGVAWVALDQDERATAVFGAVELHENVWRAWCFATDNFPQVALGVTRFIKRRMVPHLVGRGAHRCEALSIDGHAEAHRWLGILGAVQEARLRRYGRNGEDFLVFRWDAT